MSVHLFFLYSPGGDYGAVTMLVGTRSRRRRRRSSSRTEYVAVLMMVVVRVRARRWSRLLEWMWMWIGRRDDTDMENRPAGEMRLGGGSDEE